MSRKQFPVFLSEAERAQLEELAARDACRAAQWLRTAIARAHREGLVLSRVQSTAGESPDRAMFSVRLSDAERAQLDQLAEQAGCDSAAAWLRAAIATAHEELTAAVQRTRRK